MDCRGNQEQDEESQRARQQSSYHAAAQHSHQEPIHEQQPCYRDGGRHQSGRATGSSGKAKQKRVLRKTMKKVRCK
jgi:hypothetical protein